MPKKTATPQPGADAGQERKPRRKPATKPKAASAQDEQPEPEGDAGDEHKPDAEATAEPKPARKRRSKPRKDAAPTTPAFNPAISMRWEGEAEPEWHGTLDALIRMNELDPKADAEFIEEMRDALREHGEYTGGGGASPVYVLKLAQDAQEPAGEEPTAEQPKGRKRGAKPKRGPERAQEPASSAQEPEASTEPSEPKRAKGRATKRQGAKSAASKDGAMTLAELTEKFLAALVAEQRSDATVNAYKADLGIAQRVLGADVRIDAITPADVLRFNDSEPVTISRAGQPKARPTIERTRRVLRLALDHAEAEGWITVSPCGCEPAEIEA